MPFDPIAWRRDAIEHYIALARIPVPRAIETALMQANAAERLAGPPLAGLHAELQQLLGITPAPAAAPPRNTTNRRT
jgi:hypothetical protein